MAIGVWCLVPGVTQQQYDAVMNEFKNSNEMDPGGLYHFAFPMDGSWCVFDVWESKEAFERFYSKTLHKALQKVGIPDFQPKFVPIHNMITEHARKMGH